jgi:glutamate--cysteine ligase
MQHPIPRRTSGIALATPPLDVDSASDYIRAHAKPVSEWRVGIEYELIGFDQRTLRRIDRDVVQASLRMLLAPEGIPTLEDDAIIAVRTSYGDITIEPGGQIEFSGFPERELADNEKSLREFVEQLHAAARELGIFFVGFGFDPLCDQDEQSWVLKRRYAIMRPYLFTKGARAWDMMTRTAAAQTSIDYGSETDLSRKYVLGNRLGPIVAAMYANSPFACGAVTGWKSNRYATWLETDNDRTGPGPGALEPSFDLRTYVASVLDIPAFFIEREDGLLDIAGQRLRDVPGTNVDDFPTLLSMIFTEARVREYIEMRSADSGSPETALSLAAFWKGLTYDSGVLDEALELAPKLDYEAYRMLQRAVACEALNARVEGVNVLSLAQECVALAISGLSKVAPEELGYLDMLAQHVIVDEVAPADILLKEHSTKSVEEIVRANIIA